MSKKTNYKDHIRKSCDLLRIPEDIDREVTVGYQINLTVNGVKMMIISTERPPKGLKKWLKGAYTFTE